MDVRRLVMGLGVLIVVGVGAVAVLGPELSGARAANGGGALAQAVESEYGDALRNAGVQSVGVDPRTQDVVVVFADVRPGGRPVGRLVGLAGPEGCGETDLGIEVAGQITAWGQAGVRRERMRCVLDAVVTRMAVLRGS